MIALPHPQTHTIKQILDKSKRKKREYRQAEYLQAELE